MHSSSASAGFYVVGKSWGYALIGSAILWGARVAAPALAQESKTFVVTVERGRDVGQSFGSLFEATSSDGRLIIGAGFQNLYNTRLRGDRHALQFFVRPTGGQRPLLTEPLPRPNELCGTYLYGRDDAIYATYGGLRKWQPLTRSWEVQTDGGGTQETIRIGDKLLTFSESQVAYDGRTILSPPTEGNYQLFFYANGYLCFYHVNRHESSYHPYQNDADGFSRLVACPWTSDQATVDLSQAIEFNLPIVGETTFAWGQLGGQIVTGSNVGGFYVFEQGRWRMLLAPNLGVSYQLYSTMMFHDRLLMGQYPSGRIFQYDGTTISDQPGWPPVLEGVSTNAREAQTTAIYGGEMFVGVWPWGELWRYHPDQQAWTFAQRMFDHPELSTAITHPYDVEKHGNAVSNLWGQRITSLVPNGSSLFVSTSAKAPCEWEPAKYPFLAPDRWKSYGSVTQLTMPGHLSAATHWTEGPTTFELSLGAKGLSIAQDGQTIATGAIDGPLAEQLQQLDDLKEVRWGQGIYGTFGGQAIQGSFHRN